MKLLDTNEDSRIPKKFILHWQDGLVNEVEGTSIAEAMNQAGYGRGALKALDYWEEIKEE